MFDNYIQARIEGHARAAAACQAPVRRIPDKTLTHQTHEPCPTCGAPAKLFRTEGPAPEFRWRAVEAEHLLACERSIIAVRGYLLSQDLLSAEAYEHHLPGCVGSPWEIAELARVIACQLKATRRELVLVRAGVKS